MMKKIFKLLGVFLCVICLIILAKIFQDLIYSASSVTCLESKPEDTYNFGKALAINDNYIAVGDPEANRVAIYSYDNSKTNWSRTREIYPPKNSIISKVGSGFGSSLVFSKDQLIVGAYSEPKTTFFGKDVEGEQNEFGNDYHGAVYSLQLDKDNQSYLKEIVLPESIKLTGYSITTFNNKIALGATTGKEPGEKNGKVLIINPTTLQVEKTIEPPSLEQKFLDFGFVLDGNDNFLLVGSQGLTKQGGALLIDQAGKIEEISSVKDPTSPIFRSGSSIALSNHFVVVGNKYSGEAINTLLLSRATERWSLIDLVNFGGSLDATESYILISTNKETNLPTSTFHLIHMLVKLDHKRVEIVSKIRWKWSSDYRFDARGNIYNDHLLLSYQGKVVLLSIKHLPRNYVINRLFCKQK